MAKTPHRKKPPREPRSEIRDSLVHAASWTIRATLVDGDPETKAIVHIVRYRAELMGQRFSLHHQPSGEYRGDAASLDELIAMVERLLAEDGGFRLAALELRLEPQSASPCALFLEHRDALLGVIDSGCAFSGICARGAAQAR